MSDSDSVELSVDLEVSIGTLTLGSPDGVTFTVGDGISDNIMAFTGTVDNLNAALDGLLYETQADVSAEVTLTLKTTETVSPNLSDTDVLNIIVNPINDAPVVTVPDAQSVVEEGTLTFSSANSNAFGIIDDASTLVPGSVQVSVTSGTVAWTDYGLTITSGADESATVTFDSEVAAALAALEGLAYMPSMTSLVAISPNSVSRQGGDGNRNAEEVTARPTTRPASAMPRELHPLRPGPRRRCDTDFLVRQREPSSVFDAEEAVPAEA